MTARGKKASQREARRRAAEAKARKRRILIWSGVTVVIVGIIAATAYRPLPEGLSDVERFADLGGGHLTAGDPQPQYNSSPATSGPHAASPTGCGIYTEEVPDVVAVHNLEHGTVAIHYRDDLPDSEVEQLRQYARSKSSHILIAPRSDLPDPVVVTSWARLLRLQSVDIDVIESYYDRFAFLGPETGVACPFQVDQAA